MCASITGTTRITRIVHSRVIGVEEIKRVKKQSRVLGKQYKVIINKKRHQRSESECGMYCLYVIIDLLKGSQTFKELTETRIPDIRVKTLRKVYYNQDIKGKR